MKGSIYDRRKNKKNVRCVLSGKKNPWFSPGAARWSKAGIYTVYGYNSQIAGKWSAEGQDFWHKRFPCNTTSGCYKDGQRDGRKVLSEEDFVWWGCTYNIYWDYS